MTDIPSESTPAEPVPDRASSSGPAAVNLSRGILFNVVIPLALLVAGGAVVALLGTAEPQKRPEPDTSPAGLLRSLPPARVAKLQSLESTGEGLELEVDGVVVPFQEARVAAEVSGRIVFKEKVCEAGGYVRANQLLMKIDSSDYLLDVYRLIQLVKQEKQAIEEANQELDNAKESAGVAERDYALQEAEVGRLESLGQFSSKAEIDQATRALLAAKQQLVSIENQSKLAEQRKVRLIASLDLARAQLFAAISNVFRTEIRAPIEGVIVSEQADLNTFVTQGATLVTIEKTSKVEVASSLRMDQLQWVMDQDQPQETEAELEKADELNKGGEGFANTGIRFPDAAALVSGADQALLDEHVQLFRAVEDELKANLKVAEDKKNGSPANDQQDSDCPDCPTPESNARGYALPKTKVIVEYVVNGRDDTVYRWNGHLLSYDGIGLDPETRTVPVRVVVDQPRQLVDENGSPIAYNAKSISPALLRGMYVRVRLQLNPRKRLLVIPANSLQPGNRILQFLPKQENVSAPLAYAVAGSDTAAGNQADFDPQQWERGSVIVRKAIYPINPLRKGSVGVSGGKQWVCEVPEGSELSGESYVIVSPMGDVGADRESADRESAGEEGNVSGTRTLMEVRVKREEIVTPPGDTRAVSPVEPSALQVVTFSPEEDA